MLQGSLDSFALPDVLRFVASSGATGRIEVIREEVAGELMLDQGRYVAARLDDDDAPTTEDEALDVAVLLFDGSSGTFAVVNEDWAGGPLSLDADELIAAVERRRQQWAEVVEVLGSLEDPLVLVADLPEGTEKIVIRAEQWRLLSLIDGVRSVQDIARDAAGSVYATAVALAELADKGMVARGVGVGYEAPATARKASKASDDDESEDEAKSDAKEMLRELGSDDDDATEKPKSATVRPLRVPTKEEQRVRLRR